MRDYHRMERYLNELVADVYPQPVDEGHTAMAQEVIDKWMGRLTDCKSVLDAGCGEGFCASMFHKWGAAWTGVCLGDDYKAAIDAGLPVYKMDFTFLGFHDNEFDLVFSRHSLEHSPMPLITLMEWYRVSNHLLGLVLPAPEYWKYGGKNHYSVMNEAQIEALLDRAKWGVVWKDIKRNDEGTPIEYWYMCEKKHDNN